MIAEEDHCDMMMIFMMVLANRRWKSGELLYLPFQEDIHLLEYGLENNGDAYNNGVDVQLYDEVEVELGAMTMMRLRFGAMVMMRLRLGAMVMAKVKRRQMSERGRICQTPLSSTNYSSLTRHASSSSSSPRWLPSSSSILSLLTNHSHWLSTQFIQSVQFTIIALFCKIQRIHPFHRHFLKHPIVIILQFD